MAACLAAGIAHAGPSDSVSAWPADYDGALAQARARDRLVVVHFARDDRPVCRAMERETLAHPDVVRQSAEHFLNVRIDALRQSGLFERLVGGPGGLATCVVDGTGDAVAVLPGFAGPEAYLRFLETAREGYPRLRAAREAASASPNDPAALYGLAEAYRLTGHRSRAEELYGRVIALAEAASPPPPEDLRTRAALSHERLARIRASRGRNLEARRHVEAYRRLDPDGCLGLSGATRLTEAMACAIEMKYAEAARILDDTLADPPADDVDQALYAAGAVRHETGEHARAVELLERLLREHPRSAFRESARERIDHIRNPPPGHAH